MIRASAYGRLGADPVERETRGGKVMTTARIAVNVGRPGDDPSTEWFDVISFGKLGETLARHGKGELVALMGPMTRRTWTDRDGNERLSWSLTVEAIMSARTVRPSGGKRRPAAGLEPSRNFDVVSAGGKDATAAGPEFDDALPF